jgi:hypothetical protein
MNYKTSVDWLICKSKQDVDQSTHIFDSVVCGFFIFVKEEEREWWILFVEFFPAAEQF